VKDACRNCVYEKYAKIGGSVNGKAAILAAKLEDQQLCSRQTDVKKKYCGVP
jgi:hypothetical protein